MNLMLGRWDSRALRSSIAGSVASAIEVERMVKEATGIGVGSIVDVPRDRSEKDADVFPFVANVMLSADLAEDAGAERTAKITRMSISLGTDGHVIVEWVGNVAKRGGFRKLEVLVGRMEFSPIKEDIHDGPSGGELDCVEPGLCRIGGSDG